MGISHSQETRLSCAAEVPVTGSVVTLSWRSFETTHQDLCCLAGIAPREVAVKLGVQEAGDVQLETAHLVASWNAALVIDIEAEQFAGARHSFVRISPRVGQHYPCRLLTGIAPDLIEDKQVFRCLAQTSSGWRIDLNPPLSGANAHLKIEVSPLQFSAAPSWDGNSLRHRLFGCGPGLQARREDVAPDWPTESDLQREDENDDGQFYNEPRFVTHIDDTTIEQVSRLYARLINPGARVLDLMSSWISHLPEGVEFEKVTGLGMNHRELSENLALDEFRVHNLNAAPTLPFADASFDAIVCCVSVEYLAQPLAVFQDVRRVLTPGGVFINTFSNRCFPTKAIALWAKLHEFERMGLISHFYHQTGFTGVNTWSLRGLPRPFDDHQMGHNPESDPVYAVWASAP